MSVAYYNGSKVGKVLQRTFIVSHNFLQSYGFSLRGILFFSTKCLRNIQIAYKR